MKRLQELANTVGGRVAGSDQVEITAVSTVARADAGDITFAATQKHYDEFLQTNAAAVIVSPQVKLDETRNAIVVDDVVSSFTRIVEIFRPPVARNPPGISPQAIVSETAVIADGVSIYPGAVVMDGAKIGSGTIIFPNVTVMENCEIGANCKLFPNCVLYENTIVRDRVILHAGVVLGAYGFGYKSSASGHSLSAQLGNVVVESDVELGSNTTIDRGTFDSTTIGEGTKMDDQVMVGHNCKIGKHNLFCSQVGIAGSCTTGDFVVMGGQVGLGDHLTIGSNVSIGAKSGLMQDVESNQQVQGIPGRPARQTMQIMAVTSKLPAMRKDLKKLQKQVDYMVNQSVIDSNQEPIRDAA
jgi:UDP-3-O-[3-hydroxymyristoyl] glucosamine N-acyltransferase